MAVDLILVKAALAGLPGKSQRSFKSIANAASTADDSATVAQLKPGVPTWAEAAPFLVTLKQWWDQSTRGGGSGGHKMTGAVVIGGVRRAPRTFCIAPYQRRPFSFP